MDTGNVIRINNRRTYKLSKILDFFIYDSFSLISLIITKEKTAGKILHMKR